jgi:hypothetical protein
LKVAGEVENGSFVGEGNPVGAGDLVEADLGVGGFKRPGNVVNVADQHAS